MNSAVLHREAAPWIERLARLGYASKGLVYAVVGFLAAAAFGHWIIALIGLGALAYGVYQIYRAWKGKLGTQVHIPRGMMTTISRFGLASRGVVFLIIGASLVFAGGKNDPGEARGTSGALRELASQPFGHVLLTLMGIGLVSYGIYVFLQARYRRIEA